MPKEPCECNCKSAERLAFEFYLRTGRRLVSPRASERKFNPYHDPRNGQFTFAPGGPRSVANPIFSDRHGLSKPKAKPDGETTSTPPTARSKGPPPTRRTPVAAPIATRDAPPLDAVRGRPENRPTIPLPLPPKEANALVRVSSMDDEAEYANCPEGGSCRETLAFQPRNQNEVEIAINDYRRFILEDGWKDNDFQNLVAMRRSLIAFLQERAIASHIENWDPIGLLPEGWLAENIVNLVLEDPDDPIGKVAYYLTLGIDGPGPRPTALTVENLMNPVKAVLEQEDWAKKELLHQGYQALVGTDPIFASTVPVEVSGKRPIDRSDPYEVGVRGLYGGDPTSRPPEFRTLLDGKWVAGQADYATMVDGKETAIDAKFTRLWSNSLRNPSSSIGERHFSVKAQTEMIQQARKYESAYQGGAIYHTNSVEFARFYTRLFNEHGIQNFHFVITPSR